MKVWSANFVLIGFLMSSCTETVPTFDAEQLALGTCVAEIEKEFREKIEDMDIPDPQIEIDNDSISFKWDRRHAEDYGGPILCTTDSAGQEILEIELASAPMG